MDLKAAVPILVEIIEIGALLAFSYVLGTWLYYRDREDDRD